MTRRPPRAARPRLTATGAALVVTLALAPAGMQPARAADPTPLSCPSGSTPTTPSVPSPHPSALGRTPAAPVTPVCQLVPPTPQPGPVIAPEHTVGGPALAATGLVIDAPPTVPDPPATTDVAWTVSDLDTGEVLAAKSPHALLLPASTIKTLLALVTMPALPPGRIVRASKAATLAEGTRVGLVEGASYGVGQLFLGLVMVSGNDTAYALADAYGGRAKTVAAMNAAAAGLGAWDTVAVDPSGLDAVGQRSSAYDLALIGRAVMKLPDYRRVATTRSYLFPGGTDPRGKKQTPFQIQNHNPLMEHYPGVSGVKNGYTTGARHTFVGTATRGGRTLLVTQMGGVTVPSWKPTAALLDWAFAHRTALRPVGTLVDPGVPQPPEWRDPVTPSPAAAPTPLTTSTPTSDPAEVPVSARGPVPSADPTTRFPYAAGLAALAALLGVGGLVLRARRPRSG
ncbi:hypothetical protein V3N99_05145 [Dermatophilaceae bacterium Soc4.6]